MPTCILFFLSAVVFISACSPEVGSDDWCEDLKEKDKGDWMLDETAEYARNCIL